MTGVFEKRWRLAVGLDVEYFNLRFDQPPMTSEEWRKLYLCEWPLSTTQERQGVNTPVNVSLSGISSTAKIPK